MNEMTAIVLEDDPFWMNEIGTMLRADGVEVFEAASVEDALALQKKYPKACFIVDIILPEADGIEFIKAAKAIDPDTRVLAISGGGRLGSEFYLRLADAFGALCTLQKPFNASQLAAAWAQLQKGSAVF